MKQKWHFICSLLRERGLRSGSKTLYEIARLKLAIFVKGRNRVVALDGCQFALSKLPNTTMKLELLTGSYEEPERKASRSYIRSDWAVVELGGCVGVVACITNKLLQNPKAHIVVEANPLVIPHLQFNRESNQCSFKVINAALAYDQETVTFSPWLDFWGNSLHRSGDQPSVTVAATQLRRILEEEHLEKFALICDIEGQEYELVMREPEALRAAELIILEVHPRLVGEDRVESLLARLGDLGFRTIERSAMVVVLTKA
jgi:FkbM family methyltransferase